MVATARQQTRARCKNCDSPSTRLGRLVMMSPSGKRLTLLVCRFCYLQLSRHALPGRA